MQASLPWPGVATCCRGSLLPAQTPAMELAGFDPARPEEFYLRHERQAELADDVLLVEGVRLPVSEPGSRERAQPCPALPCTEGHQ